MIVRFLKKAVVIAAIGGIIYGFMAYHCVFYGTSLKFLRKVDYTFHNTFVSVTPSEYRDPIDVMRQPDLLDAGIGYTMVEFELITDEERMKLEERIASE